MSATKQENTMEKKHARYLPRSLPRLLADFFMTEASGGFIMLFAALLAIVLANVNGFDVLYQQFIHSPLHISFGNTLLDLPFKLFVQDVLMVVFFLFVGLELKREMLEGFLSKKGQKILPACAALGGIICPALIYYGINSSNSVYLNGWAIPTATDIAFAVGVLVMFGRMMPPSTKVLLLAIAIYDDLAAILIIALFYGSGFDSEYAFVVMLIIGLLFMVNRLKIPYLTVYYVLCGFLAVFLYKMGLHTTIAGVITAVFIPLRSEDTDTQSPLGTVIDDLHPWVSYCILPLFAFVSAGIAFDGLVIDDVFDSVPLGIILALFIGKQMGIFSVTYLLVQLNVAIKPEGSSWLQIYAVSVLAGIGFTMSLFIGLLAFDDVLLQSEVKIGVIIGSVLSAIYAIFLINLSKIQDK